MQAAGKQHTFCVKSDKKRKFVWISLTTSPLALPRLWKEQICRKIINKLTVSLAKVMGSNGFSHRTNLVDFQQQTVASLLVHSGLNTFWISHSQIISNDLDFSRPSQFGPAFPVVLVEGILNAHNWGVFDKSLVHFAKFVTGNPVLGLRFGILEVQIVLS